MLEVQDLHSYYGLSHVLQGVSFTVPEGSVAALLGRNGAGKTTALRSIMGLMPGRTGRIELAGEDISNRRPHQIARLGVSYVSETRGIFASLSVLENLRLPLRVAGRREGPELARTFALFPRLAERRHQPARVLSGGEQQMLAIARGLLLAPRLLILDEPTEGLAPVVVQEIEDRLRGLKQDGLTILLVEQNLPFATRLADRVYVLGKGQIRWQGTAENLRANDEIKRTWLGI